MTVATQEVITPSARRTLRRALFWIAAALFVLLVAVYSFAAAGTNTQGRYLAADNPAPAGGMAVAEVLRQQGVDVIATDSLAQTRRAIDDPSSTTLLLYDTGYLEREQLREAVELAGTVVLVDPTFGQLQAVAPSIAQAGSVGDGMLEAGCDVPAARTAGEVSGEAYGYRVVDDDAGAEGCFASDGDVSSLVALPSGLVILGTTGALTNGAVLQDGNAALALNLLGGHDTLVWYLPTAADLPDEPPATIGDLTPPWVLAVVGLLIAVFVAAAVWRGRRLGPLVIENLPVTVKASETMLGRARLYEKSSARLRALDALRVGSIQRLAAACGLPRSAGLDEVVAAVASVTGAQVGDIHRLLVDDVPGSDADLVRLSDALLTLERDVAKATRP